MDTDSGAELQLWTRSLDGDSAAFGVLFDKHRDRVFRHAFYLLGNVHDAEDAAATAFLQLWRRRKHVRVVEGSILPWLLITTTNSCRNIQRATRRYKTFIDALPREPDAIGADEELLRRYSLDSVGAPLMAELKALKPTDMQLFALVNIEGFPIADAAAVLGLSATAAKTRLHRSRVRLRAALGGPHKVAPPLVTGTKVDPS